MLQRAGNRRADLQQVEATTGEPRAPSAIGNGECMGAALADVLLAARADEAEILHVRLEGETIVANDDAEDAPRGVSIPPTKAMSGGVSLG